MQHPMVEQVDRLVGNALAGGGELFLPGVGSLHTRRQAARRLSRRSVVPPLRAVEFTSQQRGVSLVDEIKRVLAEAARLDNMLPDGESDERRQAQAQDIYDRWLSRTLSDGVLTITGVGVLKFKHFTPDASFDRRINPQGHEPVRVRFGRRFDWALCIGGAALLFAAGIGGYEFLMLYSDEMSVKTVIGERAAAEKTDGDGSWIERAVAGKPVDASGARSDGGAALAAMPEGAAERAAMSEDAAQSSAVPDDSRTAARQEEAQSPVGVESSAGMQTGDGGPAATESARSGNAAASASRQALSAANRSDGTAEAPATLVSGCRYVVLGVFSTVENASRAVREAVAKEPSLRCGIFRFGDKYLVSPFVSDDAGACARFIREQAAQFPGMWTYKAR